MIEQEQSSSQLSALFDGELPTQHAEMVIRRALKDPSMRRSWERYALIGACLREEPLRLTDSVADRVQTALAGERELNVSALPARNPASMQRTFFPRGGISSANSRNLTNRRGTSCAIQRRGVYARRYNSTRFRIM